MSRLNAEHLVPDHTTPLHGEKRVHEPLTDYAAAIRTVFDQTVEGMNRLEDPVTIAQGIRLSEELGGRNAVFGKIDQALSEGDAQWALELIEMLKDADLTPDEKKRLTTVQIKGCRDLAFVKATRSTETTISGGRIDLRKRLKKDRRRRRTRRLLEFQSTARKCVQFGWIKPILTNTQMYRHIRNMAVGKKIGNGQPLFRAVN